MSNINFKTGPEHCFSCGHHPLEEFSDGEFTCTNCHRTWVRGNGQWETIPRKVNITRPLSEMKEGDNIDDFISPKLE